MEGSWRRIGEEMEFQIGLSEYKGGRGERENENKDERAKRKGIPK
jgi:hypothetical protein